MPSPKKMAALQKNGFTSKLRVKFSSVKDITAAEAVKKQFLSDLKSTQPVFNELFNSLNPVTAAQFE